MPGNTTTKPTILFVITQGGPWGGAQKYVFDLAQALKNDYHIVVAVGELHGEKDLQKKLAGIQLVQLRHLRRNISPYHDAMAALELKKLYKKIRPDIVHLNSSKASILGSFSRLRKQKIVYTVHGWVFNEPLSRTKKFLYRQGECLSARQKDRLIVLSSADEKTGREMHIAQTKLAVIPPGIPEPLSFSTHSDARAALRAHIESPISESARWIGVIANFYPTKGLDVLLHAFSLVRRQLPETHLIMIGNGPEREMIKYHQKLYKLEDVVHLTGFLDDAASYLPAFDLFVLPSRKEGMPYVLLEAMRAGIPSVATTVGGVASLIEHKTSGLLVKPDHAKDLGDMLMFALTHPQKMNAMAVQAKKTSALLTTARMVEKTKELYQSLLQLEESD